MSYPTAVCLLALLGRSLAAQDGPLVLTPSDLGESAPAPAQGQPATSQLAPGCPDLTRCTSQELSRGGLCGADDSLAVKVTNRCSEAVALNVCLERSDGAWECSNQKRIKVGQHDANAFHTCHGTGRYRVLATRAAAKGLACFKAAAESARAAAPPPLPFAEGNEDAPPPPPPAGGGACAAAQACCRALVAIKGMEAMASACSQLAAVTDDSGAGACAQILGYMKQTVAQMPNPPPACQ